MYNFIHYFTNFNFFSASLSVNILSVYFFYLSAHPMPCKNVLTERDQWWKKLKQPFFVSLETWGKFKRDWTQKIVQGKRLIWLGFDLWNHIQSLNTTKSDLWAHRLSTAGCQPNSHNRSPKRKSKERLSDHLIQVWSGSLTGSLRYLYWKCSESDTGHLAQVLF